MNLKDLKDSITQADKESAGLNEVRTQIWFQNHRIDRANYVAVISIICSVISLVTAIVAVILAC